MDLTDLARFLGTLGRRTGDTRYLAYMDYNADGLVGLLDTVAFARRLGSHLNP